jgi:hypothetical protein
MDTRVRCSSCGLLTIAQRRNGELVEVDKQYRDGSNWPHLMVDRSMIRHEPLCLMMAFDLQKEFRDAPESMNGFGQVVGEKRDCEKFVTWNQSFTPKEHHEMLLNQQLLDSQLRRESADRDWRASEAAKVEARHQQDSRKAAVRFWIGFILAMIVTVSGQIVSAIIQHNWPATPVQKSTPAAPATQS